MRSHNCRGKAALLLTIALLSIGVANPNLAVGVWTNITPPSVPQGVPNSCIGQGVAFDPNNHTTIYWCNGPFSQDTFGGLYKSTDAGSTWVRMGDGHLGNPWDVHSQMLTCPIRIRIDPNDSKHMFCGVGVRGNTAFWVTTDGGANWDQPDSFVSWAKTTGCVDVYDVAVDPTDFNHVLLSFHSGWQNNVDAGIAESKDGGQTWITHRADGTGGAGKSIAFLYAPAKGIGNSQTWLMGTQGSGYWRTSNSGASWSLACPTSLSEGIFHGGGTVYYSRTGVLYASSYPQSIRSTDNGVTWTATATATGGTTCVYGDGNVLYTAFAYGGGNEPFYTSPETDGTTWTAQTQQFNGSGPDMMAYDSTNGIIYASMWFQGLWAMKIGGTTAVQNSASSMQGANKSRGNPACTLAGNRNVPAMVGALGSKTAGVYDFKGRQVHSTQKAW